MIQWISSESWEAFRLMRKQIKAPLTPYAEKLIMMELVKLKAAGHDPQACLDQSIMLGWRDVWPPKEKGLAKLDTDKTQDYLKELEEQAKAAVKPSAEVRAKLQQIRRAV